MGETLRAVAYVPPGTAAGFDHVVLRHDERRVRRRLIPLSQGDEVLVDFPQPVTLDHHGLLKLEDGRHVEIIAADEDLYEIRGRDAAHLMQLAWHIGNRHTKAQIVAGEPAAAGRILILRDHVLRDMLRGLGARVTDIV